MCFLGFLGSPGSPCDHRSSDACTCVVFMPQYRQTNNSNRKSLNMVTATPGYRIVWAASFRREHPLCAAHTREKMVTARSGYRKCTHSNESPFVHTLIEHLLRYGRSPDALNSATFESAYVSPPKHASRGYFKSPLWSTGDQTCLTFVEYR